MTTAGIIDCFVRKEWIYYLHCCFFLLHTIGLASNAQGESTYIRTPQSQIVALADKDAILRCDFSYPGERPVSHIIEWSKKGQDVPIFILYQGYPPHIGEGYEGRLALAEDTASGEKASLLIKKVQRDDEGWYECKVQLLNRPPETPKNGSWIYLVVHAPPQIISAPPWEMYVKQNEQIHFHCQADGTPRPKISWTKDGQAIRTTAKLSITADSLTIRSVITSDSGSYECCARNAEGRECRSTRLHMASGAVILRPPENLTRLEGDRATLHCKAEGKPNNLTFHWLLNETPIQSSYYTELSTRVVVQTDGTLIINPTNKGDSGKYTCKVTNGIEETPEASAWLSIHFPARITSNPSLQYLPLHLSGLVRCFIESQPTVQFVQWTKDSRVLDPKAVAGVSVLANGSLYIQHVTMDHQGQYTCTPYNAHGTSGSSVDMNVLVEEPPTFAVIPKQFHQAEQKGTVTMLCSAKVVPGKPKPRLYWRRGDGATLPDDRSRQHDGHLVITNLRKTDHGSYDCILENEVATLVATTTLLIESTTPHAPANVTVDVGPFSAHIRWQPAYNGGFAQHYVIWYRHFGASSRQWRTLRVRPDDTSSFTVYNLTPDSVYEFQVLSRNQLGDGMFSDPVIIRTKDIDSYATVFPTDASGATYVPSIVKPSGARPASPLDVKVTSTPDGARIEWEGPQNSTVPIMYYMVEYRKAGEPWGRSSGAVQDGRTFYIAKDIQSGQTYEFRVYAFTLTSFSEPSQVQKFVMTNDYAGNLSPSVAITAGVVGGIIFFVVLTILLLLCAGCARRRRKVKRDKYEDSNGFHPAAESSTLTLKRGYDGIKARGVRRLRMAGKVFGPFFPAHHSQKGSARAEEDEELAFRQPLSARRRGCSVQLKYTCIEKANIVLSGNSSDCMKQRPCVDSIFRNRIQHEPLTMTHDHHHHHQAPFYIPYTPTRSDIYQDYLDASGHIASSDDSVSVMSNYDRQQLYETIQRLRATLPLRPSADQSENTDSGVGLLNASQDGSPSSSSTLPPTGTTYCISANEKPSAFDLRNNLTKAKNIVHHNAHHYMNIVQDTLVNPDTDARCQALIEEFRQYKLNCSSGIRMKNHLSSDKAVQVPCHLITGKKPPLESEC